MPSVQARTKQTARKTIQGRTPAKAPKKTKKTARKSAVPSRRLPAPDRKTQIQRAMRKVKRGTRALQCVTAQPSYTIVIIANNALPDKQLLYNFTLKCRFLFQTSFRSWYFENRAHYLLDLKITP